MPTERIAMRRVREMIRLKLEGGLSISQIAIRCGIARSTLREMVNRHAASSLGALNRDLKKKRLVLALAKADIDRNDKDTTRKSSTLLKVVLTKLA